MSNKSAPIQPDAKTRAHDRLTNSALGDLLATICLCLIGYVIFVIAGCLQ